jgi:hypothetical protein
VLSMELMGLFRQYWLWCGWVAPVLGAQFATLFYDLFFFTGMQSIINQSCVSCISVHESLTDTPAAADPPGGSSTLCTHCTARRMCTYLPPAFNNAAATLVFSWVPGDDTVHDFTTSRCTYINCDCADPPTRTITHHVRCCHRLPPESSPSVGSSSDADEPVATFLPRFRLLVSFARACTGTPRRRSSCTGPARRGSERREAGVAGAHLGEVRGRGQRGLLRR